MRFEEIVRRITGLSGPFGLGVSWEATPPDVTHARRLFTFLEDRRILYVPHVLEVPSHCVMSVIEIRHYLTAMLQALDEGSELAPHVRAMRAACRKFLNATQDREGGLLIHGTRPGHFQSWTFLPAIGELRGVFGVHLALIASKYGLDIEDDLASILPEKADVDTSVG